MKCASCVEEYIEAKGKYDLSSEAHDELWSKVEDMITMLPTWNQVNVGGSIIFGCIALPTCLRHIKVNEPSPEQIAQRNGLLLPTPSIG